MSTTQSVTATAVIISWPMANNPISLYNEASDDVYARRPNSSLTAFAGTAAVLDALSVLRIRPGQVWTTPGGWNGVEVACATGLSATLQIGGGKLAANSGVDIGDVDVTSLPDSIDGPGAPTIDSYTSAVVDCSAGATTSVIATPGASKQLWIYGLMGTADTVDTTIVLKSATTAKTGTMPMADNGGFVLPPSGNFAQPWIKCATNEAFQITTATGTFDGVVSYAIVSV